MTTVRWNVLLLSFVLFASAQESKRCPPPSAHPQTSLDKKYAQKQAFNQGEKVYFSCAEDFTPSRGSRAVQCLETGEWTKLTLKCEKKTCGNAGELSNGQYLYNGEPYVGERVYAECNKGYTLKGPKYLTCKKSGWTDERPSCEVGDTTCSAPVVANSAGGRDASVYRAGDNVTFTCRQGFRLDGAQQATCGPDGQWQPPAPLCRPSPTKPTPSSDRRAPSSDKNTHSTQQPMGDTTCSAPVVANSAGGRDASVYRAGDNVTFTCRQGFRLDGAQQVTCGPDGQWQPPAPLCRPSPTKPTPSSDRRAPSSDKNTHSTHKPNGCVAPPAVLKSNAVLADKYVTMASFASGAKVQYVCGVGYVAAGGSRYRTCKNGKWSRLFLKCERRLCGSAGEILNGRFTYTGVEFGDKATAVCDEGFNLVGKATRNCMSSGWDGRVPECEAAVCPEPPQVANAEMVGLSEESYTYRSAVRYRCLVGTLIGEKSITCNADGTWSAPPPTCQEITCPYPTVANAAWRAPASGRYQYRETLEFVCHRGFALSGSAYSTCGADGRWHPEPPQCYQRSRSYGRIPYYG